MREHRLGSRARLAGASLLVLSAGFSLLALPAVAAERVAGSFVIAASGILPDETLWKSISGLSMPDLFQQFIERYPDSKFRPEAEARLQALQADEGNASAEDQAGQLLQPGQESDPAVAADQPAGSASGSGEVSRTIATGEGAPAGEAPVTADEGAALIAELDRLGCAPGTSTDYGPDAQIAVIRFGQATGMKVNPYSPPADLLDLMSHAQDGVCQRLAAGQPASDAPVVYADQPADAPVYKKAKRASAYVAKSYDKPYVKPYVAARKAYKSSAKVAKAYVAPVRVKKTASYVAPARKKAKIVYNAPRKPKYKVDLPSSLAIGALLLSAGGGNHGGNSNSGSNGPWH